MGLSPHRPLSEGKSRHKLGECKDSRKRKHEASKKQYTSGSYQTWTEMTGDTICPICTITSLGHQQAPRGGRGAKTTEVGTVQSLPCSNPSAAVLCHNKPVLKKSPGWWWKFDKHEHFNCLSVINCIIMSAIGWGNDYMHFKLSHKPISTGLNCGGWQYNECNFTYFILHYRTYVWYDSFVLYSCVTCCGAHFRCLTSVASLCRV